MTNRVYPMDFGLHQGGDTANSRERTSVRDWDERGKPTQMQPERRRVYIAIGSNLASPLEQVNAAIQAIGEIPDSRIMAVSSFYRTPPLGPQDQPDYLNAAVALETTLAPEALLDHTQRIELQQGRVRKAERWGPRTLDLDIMLFGDEVINTERLTVPHYDMKNRGFMLWPLVEIAPELLFPGNTPLRTYLAQNYPQRPALW
ncbi:2-amino-4-hydroxy-6-hydroxymethyldihydropteridine diphosphokinase [Citrobacter freundii]|nr:2-amino-4-hydroxy-6-hydroxymethyldihydropteridine diphosphokinase [Citrobacter freundii]